MRRTIALVSTLFALGFASLGTGCSGIDLGETTVHKTVIEQKVRPGFWKKYRARAAAVHTREVQAATRVWATQPTVVRVVAAQPVVKVVRTQPAVKVVRVVKAKAVQADVKEGRILKRAKARNADEIREARREARIRHQIRG